MFFNPAALARQNGTQALSVFTYVRPVFKFNVRDADTATGVTINGGNGGGNVTDAAVIPALYAVFDIDRYVDFLDNFRFGLAVNAPFGLETDYQSGWAGRYQALQTKLKTINVSPTVSFDVLKGLSIGGGLQAQYVDGELSNAIDFGSIGAGIPALAPVANPTHQDGKARVDGDDWGFGWTFGILYEPWNGTRFGAGFRSQISHELDGDARFKLDQQGIGKAISGATGAFTKTGAKVHLETPATLTFGVYHDIDEQWAVMADAAWTKWSSIDEIRIRFKNPAQPDSVTDADWKDTWFFAAGTTYRPTDKWTVRLGAAYDQSPVPNRTRTPRVPDNDRAWVSLGASYQPTDAISFSAGYAHIFGKDASVKLEANDPGNQARGNLSGNVDAFVDILGVQFRWTF